MGEIHNVKFSDFENLVLGFGFCFSRSKGSHRMYRNPSIPGNLNLQVYKGEAVPYQVKQFLMMIEKYRLKLEDET